MSLLFVSQVRVQLSFGLLAGERFSVPSVTITFLCSDSEVNYTIGEENSYNILHI